MKRRDFFKGLFGAAAIAAIPGPVFEQLVQEPAPASAVGNVYQEKIKHTPPVPPMSDQIMLIYNKEEIVGYSTQFNLTLDENLIPFQPSKRVKVGRRYYWIPDYTAPEEYMRGPKSWKVAAEKLFLNIDYDKFWSVGGPYQVVIMDKFHAEKLQIMGEVYLSQIETCIPMMEPVYFAAEFTGSGALTLQPLNE